MTAAVTGQIARGMMAARTGWFAPPRVDPRVAGELFIEQIQAEIAERLEPDRLARYAVLRDAAREAVRLLGAEGPEAAGPAFAACDARLPDFAGDPELDALARSWAEQGRAYHDVRSKDFAAAERRLRLTMDLYTRLERVYGYESMYIGRLYTVFLWLRVRAAAGALEEALDAADAILSYMHGSGDSLPLGDGWSREDAARISPDLVVAGTLRVAREVGDLLCGLDRGDSARALDRLPALKRLSPETYGEIVDWARIKDAWAEGRADDFLAGVIPYLGAGRRPACLWYAALVDFCRALRALRPSAADLFCAEIAERTRDDAGLPPRTRTALAALAEEGPLAPWAAAGPARRFRLVCMGLPRSGVVSLFTLFRDFRAANEYAEVETIRMLIGHRQGRIGDDALRAYMERRDREGALEMDAASFLHLASDALVNMGGDMRFVLPVREPAAWFDSFLRELLRLHAFFHARGKTPPAWMQSYGEMLFGRFEGEEMVTPEARRVHLPDVAKRFLTLWSQATGKMLDTLPPERTLVLRTQDLEPMRGRIAAFAGLPEDALTGESHSNIFPAGPSPADELPDGWLARTADAMCGPTWARVLERCAG